MRHGGRIDRPGSIMTLPDLYVFLFWFNLALLFYTFAGYVVVVYALAWLFPQPPRKAAPAELPSVSVVLAGHNEAVRLTPRVQNLLGVDYPADKLEIIIVSDGSTDDTAARVAAFHNPRIRLLAQPQRSGKATCLNVGVAAARGEVVMFADARQRYIPETIRELVYNFSDPAVGAVSGEMFVQTSVSGVGGSVDVYWRLEKWIREAEARRDSAIGCTGCIYAIRRALFVPLHPATVLDDVVTPMNIAARGYRVLYDPAGACFDPQPMEPERELQRKQRTLAGNYQMLFAHLDWLLPWRNRLWWQLISHKYLRIAAPVMLAVILATNVTLRDQPIYCLLLAAQGLCYGLAILGLAVPRLRWRVFSWPAGFLFLNLMTVGGFFKFLRGTYKGGRW